MWTPKQIEYLFKHYPDTSSVDIAVKIGKKVDAVRYMAYKHKLKKSEAYKNAMYSIGGKLLIKYSEDRSVWTADKIKYLSDNYADMSTDDIAKHLKITRSQVYNKAHHMNLHKSEEYIKEILTKEAARLPEAGKAYRFTKGLIPFNKGQKMSAELYEKCKPTMFKPGQKPHNTKYDGHERMTKDGYIEVRIRQGKYKLKHRHVWEQTNGSIPRDSIIVFKDGNKLNCTIDNLEMITKAENMMRNTMRRFPVELQQSIKLIHKLKKQINEKQN